MGLNTTGWKVDGVDFYINNFKKGEFELQGKRSFYLATGVCRALFINQLDTPIRYIEPPLALSLLHGVAEPCMAKQVWGDVWDGKLMVNFRPNVERPNEKRDVDEHGGERNPEDYPLEFGALPYVPVHQQ